MRSSANSHRFSLKAIISPVQGSTVHHTFFYSCLYSEQVYTSPLAQVHRSSLEKGVRPVKLRVSFSDASWEQWKVLGLKRHKRGPAVWVFRELHAQSSLPWCWTRREPPWKCLLQPQSSLQMTTAPADILTATSRESQSQNHPVKISWILYPQKLWDTIFCCFKLLSICVNLFSSKR